MISLIEHHKKMRDLTSSKRIALITGIIVLTLCLFEDNMTPEFKIGPIVIGKTARQIIFLLGSLCLFYYCYDCHAKQKKLTREMDAYKKLKKDL